jgi:hypothetical protein
MMASVMIMGLVLGLELARQRRGGYVGRARSHAKLQEEASIACDRLARSIALIRLHPDFYLPEADGDEARMALIARRRAERVILSIGEDLKYEHKWEAYHRGLRTKYEHAARYPWISVAPDPPEPGWRLNSRGSTQ